MYGTALKISYGAWSTSFVPFALTVVLAGLFLVSHFFPLAAVAQQFSPSLNLQQGRAGTAGAGFAHRALPAASPALKLCYIRPIQPFVA